MRYVYTKSGNAFYPLSLRERYESSGTWPADAIEVSEKEFKTYGIGRPPEGMQRGANEDGRPTWVSIPPPDLVTLAARQRHEIDAALTAALEAGLPYTMPDGTEDLVQMMSKDRQNLLGLAIEARHLKASGIIDPVQEFRARSNTRYSMTPDQVIAVTDAALDHYKQLLKKSWDRKDDVANALADENRNAIEAIRW